MQQNRYFRNLDWWLVIAIFGLIGIGICLIASATHSFAVTTGKKHGMLNGKVCF